MSGADLYEDGFPHGTPAGYERGCKGGACPSKVETGQSCRDASVRNRSDAQYRALVASGASVDVLAQPEQLAAPAAPKPRAVRPAAPRQSTPPAQKDRQLTPAPDRLLTVPADLPQPVGETEGATGGEASPAGRGGAAGGRPRTTPEHGSYGGYQRGCRADCPGDPGGMTCTEAKRKYVNDRRAAKRAEEAAALAAEEAPSNHLSARSDDVTRVTRDDRHVTPTPDKLDATLALLPDPGPGLTYEWDQAPLLRHPDADELVAAHGEHVYQTTHDETLALAESQAADDRLTAAIRNALDIAPPPATAPTEGTPRSPHPSTPFDGMTGVMADLLRTAWMDGYNSRQDATR